MNRLCFLVLLAVACGDDDRIAIDASTSDAALPDAAGIDAGFVDASADVAVADAAQSDAAPDVPGPDVPSLAMVELTFAGCAPDLSGDVVVVRNAESIAISSTGAGSFGSIQLALQDERGSVSLGTQHRVDTGAVINIVSGTTWTNIAMDSSGVLTGEIADPIGGTLNVATYDESAGMLDVTFSGVTLQNPSDGSVCQIDGRLRTSGLSF
ncbi:MAG: hypothetical protein ACI9KE_000814 [Polyangiales bacterium]|jgi:hypothetical protein